MMCVYCQGTRFENKGDALCEWGGCRGDGFDSHPNLAEGLYQPLFLHWFNLTSSTHADIGRFTAGILQHTHAHCTITSRI